MCYHSKYSLCRVVTYFSMTYDRNFHIMASLIATCTYAWHPHMNISIYVFYCDRKAQRIVYMPFFKPLAVEDEARQIHISCMSKSCIQLYWIYNKFERSTSPRSRSYIGELLLPFVTCKMPDVRHHAKKSYTFVILAAKLVSQHYYKCSPIHTFSKALQRGTRFDYI